MAATQDIQPILENLNSLIKLIASSQEKASISQKDILTFEEAVIYTGRSASNLRKYTADRLIPHFKPQGRMVYYDRLQLNEWMRQNPIKTAEEIKQEAATEATLNPIHTRNLKSA